MVKEIQLANNKGVALVDDEDYEWLNEYKWHKQSGKNYTITTTYKNKKHKLIKMHSYLLKTINNLQIDHIDRNGLNNQRGNLRLVTSSQNQMNASKRKNTSSKYKGVYFNKLSKKWKVQIYLNGKQCHLGYFINEDDAAKAYNNKAKELFGEYANLNKV